MKSLFEELIYSRKKNHDFYYAIIFLLLFIVLVSCIFCFVIF